MNEELLVSSLRKAGSALVDFSYEMSTFVASTNERLDHIERDAQEKNKAVADALRAIADALEKT